jgi:hypothetical protein
MSRAGPILTADTDSIGRSSIPFLFLVDKYYRIAAQPGPAIGVDFDST